MPGPAQARPPRGTLYSTAVQSEAWVFLLMLPGEDGPRPQTQQRLSDVPSGGGEKVPGEAGQRCLDLRPEGCSLGYAALGRQAECPLCGAPAKQ